ncbi:hypothetical protein DM02DRAFT_529835 [Periconia macrospinosa]|uniref:DNA replication regulator SLD2 n=1 Tax=Periconia macrospinosa TaxID=97972 RepID=A0A2V1DP90_9PLEO|nr:hypothetical protein DM02DRAFT_529835 [Periconia macrospinosa]
MDNDNLEQRCNALRHDLKTWEKQFAAAHNGRKAERVDIKANAEISQKYKEYNKVRDLLAGKSLPQTPSKHARNLAHNANRTPKAAKAQLKTPTKRNLEDSLDAIAPSPSQSTSAQRPSFIGPTPQRDGRVLGLFDLLPAETPIKNRTVFADIVPNALQTPSKKVNLKDVESSPESRIRRERTPLSSGKRFMLDQFVTPKKRPRGDEGTPTSAMGGLTTPAFLRRDNFLKDIAEDDEPTPRPLPWKRRGIGRSLSAMIQSMKKQEEDQMDEEEEIMRQMEMEESELPPRKKQKIPEVLVQDSQVEMPLGPDRGVESEDEDNEKEKTQEQNGKVQNRWKKGLKRQTRRVIMKPNFSRTQPQSTHAHEDMVEECHKVGEAQINSDMVGSDFEFSGDEASEYESDASHSKKKAVVPTKKKLDGASASQVEKSTQNQGGPVKTVKTAARKIKATAHANYRRLKIKSKGGNGGKGRGAISTSGPSSLPRCMTKRPEPAAYETPRILSSQLSSSRNTHPTTTTTTTAIKSSPAPSPSTTRHTSSPKTAITPVTMAEKELQDVLKQLHQSLQAHKYQQSTSLLSRAKVALLHLNALIPSPNVPRKHLLLARETLEIGAIVSIRLKDQVSFTRYFQQLQPFYALPELQKEGGNSSKITGLYLLLLLSDGDYAGFHTLLETLEMAAAQTGRGLEEDAFIQYPIRLERALMEGSYDRVWGETKSERVPSEEFGLFSEVLIGTIRKEIASCSEKAYPSIPVSDAKSLLFLDSEGSVVNFAQECGWVVKDGRIYFPAQDDDYASKDILVTSDQVIENTLGYARELETIV